MSKTIKQSLVYCTLYQAILLFASVSSNRRMPFNSGHRGGGLGQGHRFNMNPMAQFNRNPMINGFQNNFNQNNGNNNGQQNSGCSPPEFTDDAVFERDICQENSWNNQRYCENSGSWLSAGMKASLVCRRNEIQLRLRSVCTVQGTWDPPFQVRSCNELFEIRNKKLGLEIGNDRDHDRSHQQMNSDGGNPGLMESNPKLPCNKLQIRLTKNFILMCEVPGHASEVENCLDMFDRIPSGTIVALKCRPPYRSMDSHLNSMRCNNGAWEGNMRKVVCGRGEVPNNHNHMVATTSAPINVRPYQQSNHYYTPLTTTSAPAPYNPRPYDQNNYYATTPTTPAPVINRLPTIAPVVPRVPPATPAPGTSSSRTTARPAVSSSSSPSLPTPTTPMCPELKRHSSGVELSCTVGGIEVSTNDCNRKLPVGTEARYSCAAYYESSVGLPTVFRKCKDDGTWSGTSEFQCIVQCGRENIIKTPFITHSLPTIRGQWPWHAGIFLDRKEKGWEFQCGGTLVTKKAIITAGHCVTLFQTSVTKENALFRIHMGKYRREDNDELVQIKEIAEIVLNPSYNPYSYESDIAIMIFKEPVSIGYHVRPICFPQTSDTALEELQLSEGTVGTVVGWGKDETGQLSTDLRMAHLRVVGSKECSKSMLGSSLTQIQSRSTSYCAGNQNSTNVCNGDSGGGMYFPTKDSDNTRWYLQGLVSVGLTDDTGKCNPNQFSVFTRVGRYADFIVRTLSEKDAL